MLFFAMWNMWINWIRKLCCIRNVQFVMLHSPIFPWVFSLCLFLAIAIVCLFSGLVWFGRWIQCQVNLHIFKLWKWNNWERQSVFYNHRRLSSAKLTLNVNCICSFHLFHCGHLWRLLCATKQCNQRERIQLQPQLWSTRAHTSFLLHLYVLYRRI